MADTFQIHPKIGVARLGNSSSEFYIGPERTGSLPIECDKKGNAVVKDGQLQYVGQFKDRAGAIKRQAARFKIYLHDKDGAREVTIGEDGVKAIRWTVHIANKKPIWYTFSELTGDLEFGEWNSYEKQHVPLNNPDVTDPAERRRLMIDPGPRSVGKPGDTQSFSRDNIPTDYPFGSFPPRNLNPSIDSLGQIMMDAEGRLLVLGGFGTSAGTKEITSFRGASGWWDDVADGVVLATLEMEDGKSIDLEPAWVIVGSPKYAPELVNIVTLDDTMFDIAVRFLDFDSKIYNKAKFPGKFSDGNGYDPFAGFNPDYKPDYEQDIEPIIRRPESYRWVAQTPSMIEFSNPHFDTSDPTEANRSNRERYFGFFRVPVPPASYQFINSVENGPNTLFSKEGVPLMPLNSGDNSVTNTLIYKFLTLTPTQYFFLHQWAIGKFTRAKSTTENTENPIKLDREAIGNCVGGPFSPGIETTWIVRNPKLYSKPFTIKIAHWTGQNRAMAEYYARNGLSLTSDPQDGGGSEPGDLTKRMAIPWQSDFYECTVQTPNIDNPAVNQSPADDGVQIPPIYYVYWWPPQSPMQVVMGDLDPGNQVLDGYVSNPPAIMAASNGPSVNIQSQNGFSPTAAGQTVNYSRGINTFAQMVAAWADLGFIVNKGTKEYPYFIESERNTPLLAQGTAQGTK